MNSLFYAHIWGVCVKVIKTLEYPFEKKSRAGVAGGLKFYGAPDFVKQCLQAAQEELPKYDAPLGDMFFDGTLHFTYIQSDKLIMTSPTSGVFLMQKAFWDHGPEGICQFLVLSYVWQTITGTGFKAAKQKALTNRHIRSLTNERMRTWIKEKGFPDRWLASYQEIPSGKRI
jgi:hypothetical protein